MPRVSGREGRKSGAKKYRKWEDVYEAIDKGELNPKEDDYYLTYGGLDIWNTKKYEQEASARYDAYEAQAKQETAIEEREAQQKEASETIDKIFDQWPELADNQPFIDELSKGLEQAGLTLQGVYDKIEKKGGTYLDQLATSVSKAKGELTRSEAEARAGIEEGLKTYRRLAKQTEPPGYKAAKDILEESTAGALSNIKKYGKGRGLSALADVYKQEMEQKRNLGISAAEYQTQMDLALAGAETTAGTTMADIIARNAATGVDMSSTLYGAQSDWLNKLSTAQTNIAQQQATTATTMYDVQTQNQLNQYLYNQLYPTQAQLGWEQTKYQQLDPFAYQMQLLGEQWGAARADMATAIEERNKNNELITNIATEIAKGIGTGGLSVPFSGFTSTFNKTDNTIGNDIWGNPSLINPTGQ